MGMFDWLFGRPVTAELPARPTAPTKPRFEAPRPVPLRRIQWREGSFPMEAVGESNYQSALQAICGPHTRDGHDAEFEAIIEREPSNAYDSNAVMVLIKGKKVGYLPREQAERVAGQMASKDIMAARCRARIRGGWRTNQHDEGDFGVRLAIPNHGEIEFV
jgi:hypothetical protein